MKVVAPIDRLLGDDDLSTYLNVAIKTPTENGGLGGLATGKTYLLAKQFEEYSVYMVDTPPALYGNPPAFYLDKAKQLGGFVEELDKILSYGDSFGLIQEFKANTESAFDELDVNAASAIRVKAEAAFVQRLRSPNDKPTALRILARLTDQKDLDGFKNKVIEAKLPQVIDSAQIGMEDIVATLKLTEGDLLGKLAVLFNRNKDELTTALTKEYDLSEKLKVALPIFVPDVSESMVNNVVGKLIELDFDKAKAEAIARPLVSNGSLDVFDELLPKTTVGETSKHKILIGYNAGQHWLPLEIIIDKGADNNFTVKICAHDPFGADGGHQLKNTDQVYNEMQAAIAKRIIDNYPKAVITVSAEITPYARRQSELDSTSCGGHTRANLVTLAKGETLPNVIVPVRGIAMLTEQTAFVAEHGKAAGLSDLALANFKTASEVRITALTEDDAKELPDAISRLQGLAFRNPALYDIAVNKLISFCNGPKETEFGGVEKLKTIINSTLANYAAKAN